MIEDAVVIEASDGVFAVQGINDITIVEGGMQGPPGPINLISGTGIVVQTGLNAFVTRSISVGTGMSITNPDGVAGNPSITLAAVLVGIVGGSMNGVVIGNTTPAAGTFTTLNVTGVSQFASGSAAAPGIAFSAAPSSGFYRGASAGRVNATHGGTASASFGAGGIFAPSTGFFAFAASSDPDIGTGDTFLVRDAANTLAQRNAANAQIFRVYNTFTDSSNYERLEFGWTGAYGANIFEIGTSSLGTGVARSIYIGPRGSAIIGLYTNSLLRWQLSSAGMFVPGGDISYDLGNAANRVRDVYIGRNLFVGATASSGGSIVQITNTSTVTGAGIDNTVQIARVDVPASNSSASSVGMYVDSAFGAAGVITGNTQIGLYARAVIGGVGSGTLSQARAFVAEIAQSAGRTTTAAFGLIVIGTTVSAGTITTFAGVDVLDQSSANISTAISFRGRMASGASRYNLYLDGTAPNYLAGNLYVGTSSQIISELVNFTYTTTSIASAAIPALYISRVANPSNNSSEVSTGIYLESAFSGTSTFTGSSARGIWSRVNANGAGTGALSTAISFIATYLQSNGARTTSTVNGYLVTQAAVSAGTVTTFSGFECNDQNSANITTGIAYRGSMVLASNRYNLYMDGTALNFIQGPLGLGTASAAATLDIATNVAGASWTTNGIGFRIRGNTYTDNSTGISGTAATNHIHAIAAPTLAATNTTVTTTTAATLYIAGAPTAGTNMTITNARTLLIGGGVSEFPKGTASAPALRIGSTSGIYEEVTNGRIVFADGATNLARIIPGSTFDLLADGGLLRLGASSDVVLARDAANTLAQRNGTNLQTFRLYGTYTDSSNYERVELVTQAGVSVLRQTQAGTGTVRGLSLTTVGNVGISFATNNTNRYQIQNDGHLSPMTDDTYTVGAGSLRPQGVYVTRTIVLAGPTGFVNGITMSSAATTASPSIVAAGSDANITLTISSKGTGDLKLDPATGDIQITKALVALGGGAAPTLGTIGGSGPATAAQNTWLRLKDSGGNAFWVPAWK